MRILLIGINYSPEQAGIAPYTTALSEHLAEMGHQVEVITGLPHYPAWRTKERVELPEQRGLLNGVRVHRRWHYIPKSQSALSRAAYDLSFLITGLSMLWVRRPDAVVGVVPTLSGGILARIAAVRFRVPYAIVQQDLIGQAASQSGVSGGKRVAGTARVVEGWVARGATVVAIIADGFRGYLEQLGVAPDRITRVRNWSFVPKSSGSRTAVREQLGWPEDAFVCLHAGNMGYKQGLENILDCAKLSRSDTSLFFALLGDGSRRAALEETAQALGLENLSFTPTLNDQAYADALSAADVLILNQTPAVRDMSFPSKLASYLGAHRPVVAAVDPASEAGREISQASAGIVVKPGDPEALLDGIRKFRDDQKLAGSSVEAGGALQSRLFSRDAALQELAAVTMEMARLPRAGRARRRKEVQEKSRT